MSVMGAKIGTKSWSDARQNEIVKSDGKNITGAQDLQRLGEENVGQVLNRIADPNYVDLSKKPRTVGNDKMDKDAFMKLMLAQMKNQDPTNPLKSHEMAAQLAQFASVEQLQNINGTLVDMQNSQKPSESFQALSFIGKSVEGDASKIIRMKGDKNHEFTFVLNEDVKETEIKVRNQNGDIIRKINLHDLKKGPNKWVWNGKNETGNTVPVGEYTMIIESKSASGKKVLVKTDFNGTISGVSYTSEGPVLMVGDQAIRLKDVRKIVDPSIKNNDQKKSSPPLQDLKGTQGRSETEEQGAEEAPPGLGDLMANVGMSNEMMERLKKEMASSNGH